MYIVKCSHCSKDFEIKPYRFKKSKSKLFFCCRECQQAEQRIGGKLECSHYGTSNRKDRFENCLNCGKPLTRKQKKYCCIECANTHKYKSNTNKRIQSWISGEWDGSIKNGQLCNVIRNHLLKVSGYKCEKCGWGVPNPITRKPILTVNHKDGNPSNHSVDNLEILCYNCHTLTDSFGSLNTGKGRGAVGVAR